MNIRAADRQDIPGILELLRQVGQVHHEIRPDIFPAGTLKYDTDRLMQRLADPTQPVFVAEQDGQIVGHCFCEHKEYEDAGASIRRKELYIDDLCIDENSRGKGVAQALYRHVCDYATAQGCNYITLSVWNGNGRATAFYEKMGLTPRYTTMERKL